MLDVSAFCHRRASHSKTFVSRRGHNINGIETFRNQARRHLRRFNGIPQGGFYWFLKECAWRFNAGNHKTLLKQPEARSRDAASLPLVPSSPGLK